MRDRTPCPSDGNDDEWEFVVPYLTLFPEDVRRRDHSLREEFNRLHSMDPDEVAVTDDASRPAALAGKVSADSALGPGGVL